MNTLEVYSPLQDLSIICGEHRELVYAINRSLELTENTASPSQKIRKVITIQKLVDDNKRMKKYEVDSKIPWNWGDVASALYSNFDIIRKLYEAVYQNLHIVERCALLTSCFTEPLLFSKLLPVGSSTVEFSTSLNSGVLHPIILKPSSSILQAAL